MTSTTTTKPLVIVISGAGETGVSVLRGLAKTNAWRLAATVRPSSLGKPEVSLLCDLGVEIVALDWQNSGADKLVEALRGAHTVISTVHYRDGVILDQKKIIDAAKSVDVKRFIPADFATVCPPGVRQLQDEKLEIHEYIKQINLPYTFIDVSFWYQCCVPHKSDDPHWMTPFTREFCGDGTKKSAVINKDHIGTYVAKIIADPRTLNQWVFVNEDELTLEEIWQLASQAAGENLRENAVVLQEADIVRLAETKDRLWYEYMYSLYVRGDNTVEKARSAGALIGSDLYPEVEKQSVAEYVKEYFGA